MYFTSNFENFRQRFLSRYGSVKLSKIEQKVYNSNSIKKLFDQSNAARVVPNEADFSATIHSIFYFITAGAETTAMGVVIAMDYWNKSVNQGNRICSEAELYQKYLAALNRYRIS